MEERTITMHLSLEPKAFKKVAMNKVDQLALSTEEAFDKLSLVNNVSSREIQVSQSIKFTLFEFTRIRSKAVSEPESTKTVYMVVLELTLVETTTRKVKFALAISQSLMERPFIA